MTSNFNLFYKNLFEKQKFKDYKYVDYFFFKQINENNYEEYIKRLQEIIRDFKQNCENIEKRNFEILNLAIIEAKKYKNLTLALEGGLSVNRYKNVLREHKDIDFIHFNDNYFNIIQKEVSDKKITVTFEIFKYNFIIYKNSIPNLNDIEKFENSDIYIFKKEFLERKILNSFLPIKRTIILDYINLNPNIKMENLKIYNKIEESINQTKKITGLKNFPNIPFTSQLNNNLSLFLKDDKLNHDDKRRILEKINHQIHYTSILFLIYNKTEDIYLSMQIYEIIIKHTKNFINKINSFYLKLELLLDAFITIVKTKNLDDEIYFQKNKEQIIIKIFEIYSKKKLDLINKNIIIK